MADIVKAFAVFDILPDPYGWRVCRTFKVGDMEPRQRWVEQWEWWP